MFEYLLALAIGITIGIAMAVPVGPVGIVCIQRTITKDRLMGLITGFGAVIVDGFLASIAAFGVEEIYSFILKYQEYLRTGGGIILIILGVIAIFSKPKVEKKKDTAISIIENFLSGAILTGTNPLVVITFFAIFTGLSPYIDLRRDFVATYLVSGIVIGSCLWWLFLTYIADIFGHKIKQEHLKSVNKWFGIILAVLGLVIIVGTLLN